MVIGALWAPCSGGSGSCGKVYVYARPTKSKIWTKVTIITPPIDEKYVGNWVSVYGNQLLVGAANNAYSYTLEVCQ